MQLSFTLHTVKSFFSAYRFCIVLLLCIMSFFRLSGQNEPLTLTGAATENTICSGQPNGSIWLFADGGDGNYTFFFQGIPSNSNISSLYEGEYLTAVQDGSGNRVEETFYVPFQPPFFFVEMLPYPPQCHGEDGVIELDIRDESGDWVFYDNFSFEWWRGLPEEGIRMEGEQMPFLSGIGEGIYSVVVTDIMTGCFQSHTVDLFSEVMFGVSTTEADLGNNGTITITLQDGTREYTFSWTDDPAITTKDRSNLVPGNYTVKILDVAANCEETLTIAVGGVSCTKPELAAVITNALCNDEGAIDLSVRGGAGPYSYSWNNGAQTEDISGLATGTYVVTVTTSDGCEAVADFVINGSSAPVINSHTVTAVSCSAKGSFEVVASGGIAPYSMKVTGYGGLNVVVEGTSLGNLEEDCYSVQVLDANGCSSAVEMICVPNSVYPVNLSAVKTDAGCFGKSDGSIDLTVTSVGEPFTYEWSNGATTEDLQGLAAGTYEVTVTSADGCSGVLSVTITQPAVLAAEVVATPASCNGVADGSVLTSTAGGVAPYTYSWTKEADAAYHSADENPAGLSAGTYSLTVTDAVGCEVSASAEISEPPLLELTAVVSPASCADSKDGSIDITATGGTAPFVYSWNTGEPTEDREALGEGTYIISVEDANGCRTEGTYTISGEDKTPPVAKAQNVVLYLDNEGKAVLTPEQLNNGSSDNCLIATLSLSRNTFDCRDAGLDTEVELRVADASHNSSSAFAVVSVRDTIAPVIQAHDLSLVLEGEESITITAEDLGLVTSDACGVDNSSLSQYTFDESDAGENRVIVSVTDIHGNTGRHTVSVIVEKPTGLFSPERISSLKVYPVPFKDELYFETEQTIYGAELELTDALGHVVVRTDLSNISGQKLQARIETDNWKPGVYFYRILQDRQYIASGKLLLFNGGK